MTRTARTSSSAAVERAIAAIGSRLDASPLALMLDIDGTLAPIAATPSAAQIPAATRAALERLAALRDVVVALVSGRSAEDARRLGGVAGVWVVGNHGYELLSPRGETVVHRDAAPFESPVSEAARRLSAIETLEGVLLENKRWTLSVHYRNVQGSVDDLLLRVRSVAAELGLHVTDGKKVIEIRPPIDIDKGTAALQFVASCGAQQGASFYAGDDRTDEDAFRALRPMGSAVTVHVGPAEAATTMAEIVLPSPAELGELLRWMAQRRLDLA